MINLIVRYRIITDRGSGFIHNNFVSVFWDDVAGGYVVYKYTDALDVVGSIITSGPDLGALRVDHDLAGGYAHGGSDYKFCDGTTLNRFIRSSLFPYAERIQEANHFSCNVIVCDIRIVGASSTNASDDTTADGSITVVGETSSPDIRYSLLQDFADGGQLSGLFTGLVPGNYTVYAKDSRGCSTSVTVTVGTPETYQTKYRLQYLDANHRQTKIDILQRGYVGEIIEVCGGADPFVLKYNGDGELNKFLTVVPSEARLTLMSPTNFYFRELFSQDERKYKIEYYKDFGESIPSRDLIPALNTWANESAIGGPLWDTGIHPHVSLTNQPSSEYLSVFTDIPQGVYAVTYNVFVSIGPAVLHIHLNSTTIGVEGGHYDLPLSVGSNTGVLNLNASLDSFAILIRVVQELDMFPDISQWLSKSEANRVVWSDSSGAKVCNLNGNVGGFQMSQNLYINYNFFAGYTYTVTANIEKQVFSGSTGANVYFTGRNGSFFTLYSPFGQQFNGPSGTYDISITFTVPPEMSIFAMQIYVTGTGNINFIVNSIQIINSSGDGTDVIVNELSCVIPGIDGPQLQWTGYVISSNFSEPYTPAPYPVTVTATDGLADLSKFPFVDKYGNKFESDITVLDGIANILRKTDLGINIVTSVNRLEASMSNSALSECMFSPDTFYDENRPISDCNYALTQLLKSFGVRIFQRNAKWYIQTVEEMTHEADALEFDDTGTLIQNLKIYDIIPITGPIVAMRAAFINVDQVLEVYPAYGKMIFEYSLIARPSLVKSYSFELEDVFTTPAGVTAFKNWNVGINDAPGADYGIKNTKSFEGEYNFYYKIPVIPFADPGYTLVLTSREQLIEYSANDLFEYRFDYATITGKLATSPYGTKPHYPFWVRLKWSLRVGSYYFDDVSGEWTTTKKYNDIYVDQYNDNQNFKIVAPFREVGQITLEPFQVEFIFYDNNVFDANITSSNQDELRAIPTVDLHEGYRVKTKVQYTNRFGTTIAYLYYQLSYEESANDGVNTVRPNDYDDDTNIKVWVLQENDLVRRAYPRGGDYLTGLSRPSPEIPVKYQYLDNVVLRLLPNGTEPPANITIERSNNLNIKIDFEDTFLFGDIDTDNINNSERIYKNYFKRLDGNPTQLWERTYRPGNGKLLELLSGDFFAQYKDPGNKITGSILLTEKVTYSTLLKEVFDQDRYYMFMGFELHDREYSVVFDLLELKDVVNDDTSPNIDAEFTIDFNLDFTA